jgi:PIN domain nuclease of toxin-antitoxin system
VKLLLDTHCWLWMTHAPEELGGPAREAIESRDNDLFLSAASAWELVIKHALGKLELPLPPEEYVPTRLERTGVAGLAVSITHTLQVGKLPPHHRDPFDRLLIAQAQVEGLRLVTADAVFRDYEVDLLWAR